MKYPLAKTNSHRSASFWLRTGKCREKQGSDGAWIECQARASCFDLVQRCSAVSSIKGGIIPVKSISFFFILDSLNQTIKTLLHYNPNLYNILHNEDLYLCRPRHRCRPCSRSWLHHRYQVLRSHPDQHWLVQTFLRLHSIYLIILWQNHRQLPRADRSGHLGQQEDRRCQRAHHYSIRLSLRRWRIRNSRCCWDLPSWMPRERRGQRRQLHLNGVMQVWDVRL